MNKFKKIMLGALSALTLGLFVAVGTNVEAADAISTGTYTLYANDFFDSTSDGSKTAPTNLTVTPVSLASATEYYVDEYGTNRANKNATVSNPSNFDTSNWEYEYYSGGSRNITITAGDNQSISCSIYGYGTSTSKGVKFGSESQINCVAKNTVYEFSSNDSYVGTMTITVTDKLTITEIKVEIENISTYSVTFNSNGGSEVSSQTVVSGGYAAKPANPSYAGHKFLGWYTSTDGGTTLSDDEFSFTTTTITSALTLYAKWEEVETYDVTFKQYSTDITAYATVSNIAEGESIGTTNWPSNPKALNKNFIGWYDGDTEYTSSTAINSDKTLVAKYSDLANDLVKFGDYYDELPTSNANPHVASFNITTDSKVQAQEINKRGSSAVTFDDDTQLSGFIQCQKVVFTLDEAALVSIYAIQTGSGKNRTSKLFKGEDEIASFVFGYSDKTTITYYLEAGTYTVSIFENSDGSGTLANYYGIRVNQDIIAADTTASVFAEKNTAGDTLRFVGTLTGITDLANIDSIELILEKDGVATNKQIFLTTCYISVTGASQTCAEADNTYYVVYRITGISGLTGTISKQLKVTFTDGSYTLSAATEFDL